MTEIEYIKFLQDSSANQMDDSSFIKSFMNVEKAGSTQKEEERIRNEEVHALRDINDQLKTKIADLSKQVDELEQENTHLSNEHLVLLKQQENMLKKPTEDEQSTLDDTNGRKNSLSQSEDLVQVTAVKDKQIDLLSSLLAQRDLDIKNLKLEHETKIKELSQRLEASINQKEVEN